MTEPQTTINGLQVALLALLPKDGTRVTFATLTEATGTYEGAVHDALSTPLLAHQVGIDPGANSYFAVPQGNDLSTERKST